MIAELFRSAIGLFQVGKHAEAIDVCQQILRQQPQHMDALQMTGLSLAQSGQKASGAEVLERALAIQPNLPPLCNNLGELYRQLGRLGDAERLLRKANTLQPQFIEAAMNLGNTLKDQRRYPEAIDWFQKTVEWGPNYANAHLNLANTLLVEGRIKRAVTHYQQYLRMQPARFDVLLSLGGAYADLGEQANAAKYYQQAAQLDPDNSQVDAALGNSWLSQGQIPQATMHYRRMAARVPDCMLRELRAESVCEVIPSAEAYIDLYRQKLDATIERLSSERFQLNRDYLHSSGAEPPMSLAYQGRDDRDLKERYARLFEQRIAPLKLSRRTEKPHLGVVVTNGHEGVYAECLGRLVARLASRGEMNVTVVCSRAGSNILPFLLGETAVRYLALPDGVEKSAECLRDAKFDLLHYWEVGTDSMNYFLPFFQPAPIQSACWGWPVTTGNSRIQYFVSSRWIEPDDGSRHYIEQMIPLATLPTWYLRPPALERIRQRIDFGWPLKGRVYLCTQNLRKYHPDFDPMLAEILRRDSEGSVYVIEDAQPTVSQLFRSRFAQQFPDVAGRLVLVPRQERLNYLNLVTLADVVLDTPHYGGGANSIYDAFACGTPIVTRPGPFHRSRYGQAACRKLDLHELIANSADDYVSRVIQIAQEPDYRADLKCKILERCPVLFEDESAVEQHERFFLEAIESNRASE